MKQPTLPEPDVQWVDGKDQWGYDTYDKAYSHEAMLDFYRAGYAAALEDFAKAADKRASDHLNAQDDSGIAKAQEAGTLAELARGMKG